jgi:prevent-host-death family protein
MRGFRPKNGELGEALMKSVTIAQARDDLEALIAEAASGHVIEIIVDGRPAVRMIPVGSDDCDDAVPADEVDEAFYGD